MKLPDLKVADLKVELEKRGIDKTGTKSRLIEKLKNALEEEGIDVDDYEFDSTESSVKNSKRQQDSVSNVEAGEEEMETGEVDVNSSQKSVNIDEDDDDTPCSDEEMDDDNKNKDDTESARFRTAAQARVENANANETTESSEKEQSTGDKINENEEESSKNKAENETTTAPEVDSNGTDGKGNKSKVLKVIGKDKVQQVALTARTLWVTGLASTSKVSDLKNLFSKHGKVTSAKIVRSTKGTQRKWYGLLTMATSKDASTCIQKLHRTELGGHIISVERRQTAPIVKKSEASVIKKQVSKSDMKDSVASKSDSEAKKGENEDEKHKDSEEKEKDDDRSSSERYRSHEGRSYLRGRYNRVPFRRPYGFRGGRGGFRGRGRFVGGFRRPYGRPQFDRPGFRSFSSRGYGYEYKSRGLPTRDDRYEREMRFKREEEMFRHKMIVRKQREEAYRLEREKNQLRIEREMLEREKAEMIKMEKAKQRMEREQLEVEREKLRRQAQMSHASKRPFNRRGGGPPHVWADKRREPPFEGGPSGSFHREKFSGEKFQFNREHANYKKSDYPPEEFRREKIEASSQHPKFSSRDERREVTYHGAPDRRVYSREEYRNQHAGPSSSPPSKHFQTRSKPSREDWKFHERRGSGDKPPYSSRGHKRMNYY